MKAIAWVSFCWLVMTACNHVTDTQPSPDDTVPTSAIQAVTGQFPQAEGMTFKALEKKRVWQVGFTQKAARYLAATNEQMLFVAYQFDSRSAPDSLTSLVRNTVLEGGTFSNLRVQDYSWYKDGTNNGQFIFADYDWGNSHFTYRWSITKINGKISYVTELFPYYQLEYRTETLADMPALIQESLKNQQVDFNFALVQVDQQGKKQYTITVKQANNAIQLLYTDEGRLTSVNNPQTMQVFSAINQLPSAIQNYLQTTPELAGFGLGGQFTTLGKTSYNQVVTYRVNLQKGRQTWFMTFDYQGQLLTRSYLNLV